MITAYIIGQSYFLELLTNLNFREKGNFAIASYVHEMPPLPPQKKINRGNMSWTLLYLAMKV